ncbi:hypothetical protein BpHYR1_026749 [Brachionus plicatilis]|uniref:Uncharacterized protein n=1 Tax=Brachionus plicatilis TaxID=10195 RepID=A0A3M7R1E9_BRAPC|nr:hypothetical protein BpHYR1_026749 [Brachionus plicatilis]
MQFTTNISFSLIEETLSKLKANNALVARKFTLIFYTTFEEEKWLRIYKCTRVKERFEIDSKYEKIFELTSKFFEQI